MPQRRVLAPASKLPVTLRSTVPQSPQKTISLSRSMSHSAAATSSRSNCRVRLPKPENTLVIAGYQAQGTLGRALLEGAKVVRIHKGDVPVLAEIAELKGMSGHADASELLRWLAEVRAPRRVFLTHGEEEAALPLAARIAKERGLATDVPAIGDSVTLD